MWWSSHAQTRNNVRSADIILKIASIFTIYKFYHTAFLDANTTRAAVDHIEYFRSRRKTADAMRLPLQQFYVLFYFYSVLYCHCCKNKLSIYLSLTLVIAIIPKHSANRKFCERFVARLPFTCPVHNSSNNSKLQQWECIM